MCSTYYRLRGKASGDFICMDAVGRLSRTADPAGAHSFCEHVAKDVARRAERLMREAIERIPSAPQKIMTRTY
ncbi:hypothetical protein [Rhodocyclus tenuis]|uniref:Uncharacterized protein n=1 Tax=Rhodocyclus tenuis TaxID=1066 RepID=A0A840G2H8_RHOTE|nr:hypothetical protein [Rhodocyclus tenuis]MBB4248514.1 hypothetical protein [Rhodocyclus tenuis]